MPLDHGTMGIQRCLQRIEVFVAQALREGKTCADVRRNVVGLLIVAVLQAMMRALMPLASKNSVILILRAISSSLLRSP